MQQTPLMAQYFKIKEANPDTILLFRVGDFFETFEEDAKTASKVLGSRWRTPSLLKEL
jgi:DNA mismatch repair protein MutS